MAYKPNLNGDHCADCGKKAKQGQFGLYCVDCWKAEKEGKPKFGSRKLAEPSGSSDQFVPREPVDWDAVAQKKADEIRENVLIKVATDMVIAMHSKGEIQAKDLVNQFNQVLKALKDEK